MEKSIVQANFQLMDNYISEFSLNVFNKIQNYTELGIHANIGFRIVDIKEKDLIGQIELRYDIDITDEENKVAKILIASNALFKGDEGIDNEKFKNMLKINGATTLSHLCRAYINSATALAGMPAIKLPLINFYEFFDNVENKSN